MDSIEQELVLSDIKLQGLDRMRELNKEFLDKNKCSNEVRQFMRKAGDDDDLLLLYLRARKYRPEHAWETLKKRAEVRFDQYPEVFVPKPASFYEEIQKSGLYGLLKNKDRHGRRVICIQASQSDPRVLPMDDSTNAFLQLMDKLLLDDDALDNGVVVVCDAEGMGLNHARHMGIKFMLRYFYCLWYACPLKLKRLYFLNVPGFFTGLFKLVKPFFPKKLKERLSITSPSDKYSELHENIDPAILPEYLGGSLEYKEAIQFVKF